MSFNDDDDEPPDAVALGLCRFVLDQLGDSGRREGRLTWFVICADSVQVADPAATPSEHSAPLDTFKSVPVTLITGKNADMLCLHSECAV